MTPSGQCSVCGFDGATLGPRDAAVALRSLPRRYRAVLTRPDDEDRPDDVLHRRPSGGGLSAIEHATWVAGAIDQVAEAIRLVLIQDNPPVSLPDIDPAGPVPGAERSPEAVVAHIETAVTPLAERVENTHGNQWTRAGRLRDGSPVRALDLVRQAVHIGVHHLREADRTINEVARELPQ